MAYHRVVGDGDDDAAQEARFAGPSTSVPMREFSSSSTRDHSQRARRKSSESSDDFTDAESDLEYEADAYELDRHALLSDGPPDGTRRKRRRRRRRESSEGQGIKLTDAEGEDGDLDSTLRMIRKVVPETDDPSLPTLTFRVLLLGLLLGITGAAISQLFYFKSNAPSFSSFFIILISYPMGRWLAQILPTDTFRIRGFEFTLNPGPFSYKEHVLIGVLAGSGASAAYAGDIVAVQELYYHQDIGTVGGLLLLITTQVLGFGMAGAAYDILVRPTAMVWPSTLVLVTLFNTLHGEGDVLTRKRLRFFSIAFLGIFAYQFIPAVIAPTLTSIALLCIFDNSSSVMRALGSGYKGFGVLNFSLDWTVIGATGALYTPLWAAMNFYGGFAFMAWIVTPFLYFTNWWDGLKFGTPISSRLFNSNFEHFDVLSIVDKTDLSLNVTAFEEAKPIFLTPQFALSYGISFAVLSSAVVTVLLWHMKDIRDGLSRTKETDDIHVQLLEQSYDLVPRSWYLAIGGSMVLAAIYLVAFYPLQLPIYMLLLAVSMGAVFLIPVGLIAAISNTTIGLNVITELVAGFIMPGQPVANITFKVYGYMSLAQATDLLADLKLGLYMKIPPKHLFICQCLGTFVGATTNYVLIKGVINSKRQFLDGTVIDPSGQWDGRKPQIFYSASVIWGLIGPARFFTGRYAWLYMGFVLGALLPLIPWWLHKRYPDSKIPFKKISVPLILNGGIGPPQVPTNLLTVGFLASYLSQWWARKKHTKWFDRYIYVLSSALDSGTAVNALVVYFLGLQGWSWWWNSPIDTEHCAVGS